jgi:hypothetical protein
MLRTASAKKKLRERATEVVGYLQYQLIHAIPNYI